MFKDEATFTVRAGRGGDGCVSFRKEAFVPRGGPDGGNGGRGGDIIFEAADDIHSLMELARRRLIKARGGEPGRGTNSYGANAEHVIVRVPTGTALYDAETGELVADLTETGQRATVAVGGRGGRGNKSFATATHQVPREWTPGDDGEERKLRAELKLIADVGLVGMPNAGKSTLLSVVSHARPKIGAYPFTTLEPQLGIVERGYDRLVMADIPGLIEGASEGKGLGHQFLRHIERTRVLLHLIDLSELDVDELVHNYHAIRHELDAFSEKLAQKREIIAGNKCDVPGATEKLQALSEAIGKPVMPLSGASREGVEEVISTLEREVSKARREQEIAELTNPADDSPPETSDQSV